MIDAYDWRANEELMSESVCVETQDGLGNKGRLVLLMRVRADRELQPSPPSPQRTKTFSALVRFVVGSAIAQVRQGFGHIDRQAIS